MPADPSISNAPSAHHGNGDKPYPCAAWPAPPGAPWSVDYGYCRTSLDLHQPHERIGSTDPRCPVDCQHKAPEGVAVKFSKQFAWRGAVAAAAMARKHRETHK